MMLAGFVAVHDVVAVGEVQRVRHLRAQHRGPLDRQLALVHDDAVEARVDELHGQVAEPVRVPDVVDGDDVRMLELGRDLRLALEAVQSSSSEAPCAASPSRRMVLMASTRPRILSLAL